MERSRALLVAAATTVVGVASTIGVAVYTGSGLLGFGGAFGATAAAADASSHDPATEATTTTTQTPVVVTQYQDQYDRYVINVPVAGDQEDQSHSGDPAPPPSALPPLVSSGSPASAQPQPTTAPNDAADGEDRDGEDSHGDDREGEDRSDDAAAGSKSSASPMPPGCVDGQLEDNGVWNCQH